MLEICLATLQLSLYCPRSAREHRFTDASLPHVGLEFDAIPTEM